MPVRRLATKSNGRPLAVSRYVSVVMAMMTAAVPAVMMATAAVPAIVMAASAMVAHVAMTMAATMTALHLHDRGVGQRAARHQRHCRCRRRGRCEHDCDQPSLNKPLHWI